VLTANSLQGWTFKLWDFDTPERHPGNSLGTATQIGISLVVALAYKGSGKLVVDIQPDRDLMYDAGTLWIATQIRIPMLAVMFNNQAYYNDWEHQIRIAEHRGRPVENTSIGQAINDPPPDFAGLARSLGWYAGGPMRTPSRSRPPCSGPSRRSRLAGPRWWTRSRSSTSKGDGAQLPMLSAENLSQEPLFLKLRLPFPMTFY
jgi:hypothetical protein